MSRKERRPSSRSVRTPAGWNEIPESRRNEFVGVTALVDYADGRVVGTKFPADVLDSDTIECHWKYGVTGDKKGFQRADVLREFPFPEDLGRYVTEALVWNRIAMRYRTRFVNEIWATVEYLKDGLSTRNNSLRIASPKATFLQLAELIASGGRLPFRARVLASASLLRFALHARRWSHCEVIPRSCLPFAIPLGVAVFLRDRIRFG